MNNSSGAFWREGVFRTGQTIVGRSMVTVPKDGNIFLLLQVLDPFYSGNECPWVLPVEINKGEQTIKLGRYKNATKKNRYN